MKAPIARSEDEFEKFQQMDIQRRREDAALGTERRPRLMEENELPPFLLEEEEEIEEDIPDEILGRGNRSKKDTNYDDQMSEREWLKAIGVRNKYTLCLFIITNRIFFWGGGTTRIPRLYLYFT